MMKSKRIRSMSLATALALGSVIAVLDGAALAHDAHKAVAAEDVAFQPGPPSLPAGAQIAVLLGSPAEDGQFVIRLKFPAGFIIPPHRHPKEEHVTVLSGGFGMAAGEKFDSSAARILPAGSFVRIPVGQAHFAWTEEDTIVQLNGMGPFGIEYLDPKDDPRAD